MKLIMATGNNNKVKEIKEILSGTGIEVISMKEAGIDVEIIENGKTFAENAKIKAETVRDASGEMVFADDSGLVVDYMDGQPGIMSARFMGRDTSYEKKNAEIIHRLEGANGSERSARFVCAIAIAAPGKETKCFEGVFEGEIAYEPAGENGFGYDPVFYVPERGCTSAQLSPEEKNAISHRGKALRQAVEYLKSL